MDEEHFTMNNELRFQPTNTYVLPDYELAAPEKCASALRAMAIRVGDSENCYLGCANARVAVGISLDDMLLPCQVSICARLYSHDGASGDSVVTRKEVCHMINGTIN